MPSRPSKVIAVENGERIVFEPDRDAKGVFKADPGQGLFYRDSKGRALREGSFQKVSSYRLGSLLLGLFLNVMLLALWFVCLWLLLGYQTWHAFDLACVFFVVTLLFVVAPGMSRVETGARPQPVPQVAH